MTHPLLRTTRFLAGMFLVIVGLSTYGCGDSATVTEPAVLGNLSVSEGTLEPPFKPETTSYLVQLSTDVSSTTITATPRVAGDTIRIDNQLTSSQTINLDSPGAEKSVNIVVTETGAGGTSKSYTVRVKRASLAGDNSLTGLTVTPGALAPPFDKNSLNYTVSVENNIGSITVTPTLSDPLATMTVNGQAASSGQPSSVDLKSGGQVTTIPITITAQDKSTKSYVVAVSRGASNNNNLSALTVSPGSLRFDPKITAYTVEVGSGVERVAVRPTLADTTATMTVNGQPTTSGQSQTIGLNPVGGPPTIITIIVISQKGGDPKPYSVTVNRAALSGNNNLRSLTVTSQTLSPTFSQTRTRTDYDLGVSSSVGSITVNATPQDGAARVRILLNNVARTNPIPLPTGPSTTEIEIEVEAPNGQKKSYTITVNRAAPSSNADLEALSVTAGSTVTPFSPPFAQNTVTVATEVEEVVVRATKDDANATMAIGGTSVPQGTPSGQATFRLTGPATTISLSVTPQSGVNPKTFTITVNRAAPVPKPDKPAKPDLIDTDDSCTLLAGTDLCFTGSRVDDLTNVIRPRFLITVREGETPHLYIDGKEDKTAEFDSGGKTMKPGFDLPNGPHEIRSTLSNTGGESLQSDALGITIDSTPPGTIGGS